MVVFSHYTKQQQHDTHQRNRRTNTLDGRQRRHGGDYNNNTRRANDGKTESNKQTRNYMATCLFICVYMTSTTVVSKQMIKKRYCERVCVGASFASFVNLWETDGLRTSLTKLIFCTPSREKWSNWGVDQTKTFIQNVSRCTDGPFGSVRVAGALTVFGSHTELPDNL
jgi:hypothetical protein